MLDIKETVAAMENQTSVIESFYAFVKKMEEAVRGAVNFSTSRGVNDDQLQGIKDVGQALADNAESLGSALLARTELDPNAPAPATDVRTNGNATQKLDQNQTAVITSAADQTASGQVGTSVPTSSKSPTHS